MNRMALATLIAVTSGGSGPRKKKDAIRMLTRVAFFALAIVRALARRRLL